MSDPLSVVAKVASNPDQAKIYVAMLQAEGIPTCTVTGKVLQTLDWQPGKCFTKVLQAAQLRRAHVW